MSDLLVAPNGGRVHRGRRPSKGWVPVARGLQHAPGATALLAWQQVLPDSTAFSHLTAAAMHGWWLPQIPSEPPVLVDQAESDHRTRLAGIRVTRTAGPVPACDRDGLRVATPAHTLLATPK